MRVQSASTLWLFFIVCLALSPFALALSTDNNANLDPKAFATDEALAATLDSISKLPISRSPLLNESAREEAQNAIAAYKDDIKQLNILLSRATNDVEDKANRFFETLEGSVSPCQPPLVANMQDNLAGLYNYVAESHSFLQRILTPDDPYGIFSGDQAIRDVQSNSLPPLKFCDHYKSREMVKELQLQFVKALQESEQRLSIDQANSKQIIPRIQKLVDSWTARKTALEKAIEDASPAGKVADQLWPILTVFCLFAIAIFAVTRVFEESIQYELVASGQIIQFATVMVILIVVCVLGISGILKENTLGTLLGAIGGYVLSQGVGRAATLAANQAARRTPGNTIPTQNATMDDRPAAKKAVIEVPHP